MVRMITSNPTTRSIAIRVAGRITSLEKEDDDDDNDNDGERVGGRIIVLAAEFNGGRLGSDDDRTVFDSMNDSDGS
jgi:hypothetical protein